MENGAENAFYLKRTENGDEYIYSEPVTEPSPGQVYHDATSGSSYYYSTSGDFIKISYDKRLPTALAYIREHPGTNYMINFSRQTLNSSDETFNAVLKELRDKGIKMYAYIYGKNDVNDIPDWIDGVLSETDNVNYAQWKSLTNNE